MAFEKIIWDLFKIDRSDYNKADMRIAKIIKEVFKKGKIQGQKEERQRLKKLIK